MPPEGTILSDLEKAAYRFLIFQALVDIRNLCQSRGSESWNPLEWRRQYQRSRMAGALADWLHNLAASSSQDFYMFKPACFWEEYSHVRRRYGLIGPTGYDFRLRYEEQLARLAASSTAKSEL